MLGTELSHSLWASEAVRLVDAVNLLLSICAVHARFCLVTGNFIEFVHPLLGIPALLSVQLYFKDNQRSRISGGAKLGIDATIRILVRQPVVIDVKQAEILL